MTGARTTPPAARDQLTRAAYAGFAFWGWFVYCFGPAVPLVRDEQGTSRAVAGLHGTALAIGSVLAGALSVPLAARFGRRTTIVGAIALAVAGVTLMIAGPGLPFTLAGTLVSGAGGGTFINSVNPVLSDHHGERSPAIISEANAVAAACGIIAPLALGLGVAVGLTWRAAMAVTIPIGLLAMALVLRSPRLPALIWRPVLRRRIVAPLEPGVGFAAADADEGPAGRLSPAFWLSLAVLLLVVAVEFSTTFWAADLLRRDTGLSKGAASAALSVLLIGMTIGRLSAAPLTLRVRSGRLLLAAIGCALVGWLGFWATGSAVLSVIGLGVLGLGLSLQYPLAMVRLIADSNGRPDTATGWAGLAVGGATGCAPFALGVLADQTSSRTGFLLIPVLLLSAGLMVVRSGFSRVGDGPGRRDPG